jgi:hypothetical protein
MGRRDGHLTLCKFAVRHQRASRFRPEQPSRLLRDKPLVAFEFGRDRVNHLFIVLQKREEPLNPKWLIEGRDENRVKGISSANVNEERPPNLSSSGAEVEKPIICRALRVFSASKNRANHVRKFGEVPRGICQNVRLAKPLTIQKELAKNREAQEVTPGRKGLPVAEHLEQGQVCRLQ